MKNAFLLPLATLVAVTISTCEADDAKPKTIVERKQEIVRLKGQIQTLKMELEERARFKKLQVAFEKKIKLLRVRYNLSEKHLVHLRTAAKGVIKFSVEKTADATTVSPEDLPKWARGWGNIYQDGDLRYFGDDPQIFFAKSHPIWVNAVDSVLSEEQKLQRRKSQQQRKTFAQKAAASSLVAQIETRCELTNAQRETLIRRLLDILGEAKVRYQFGYVQYLLLGRAVAARESLKNGLTKMQQRAVYCVLKGFGGDDQQSVLDELKQLESDLQLD